MKRPAAWGAVDEQAAWEAFLSGQADEGEDSAWEGDEEEEVQDASDEDESSDLKDDDVEADNVSFREASMAAVRKRPAQASVCVDESPVLKRPAKKSAEDDNVSFPRLEKAVLGQSVRVAWWLWG